MYICICIYSYVYINIFYDLFAQKILMLDKDTSYNSPIEDLLENLNSLSNEASSELENKQPEELSIIHDNIIVI